MSLEEKLKNLSKSKDDRVNLNRKWLYLFFFVVILTVIGAMFNYIYKVTIDNSLLILIGLAYGSISLVVVLLTPASQYDNEIARLETEIDLEKIGEEADAKRAEKLFRSHQNELKMYYDQALKHSSLIMRVGIYTLLFGFLIIISTLFVIYINNSDQRAIIIAIVGGISSILTNFIAVIFLKMYSGAIKSTNDFHHRLVETNRLYYSNFISSKIYEHNIKEKTWSQIAINVSNRDQQIVNE